jgi:hypothetical protein
MPSAMFLFECFYNGLYFYGQWRSYQGNDMVNNKSVIF